MHPVTDLLIDQTFHNARGTQYLLLCFHQLALRIFLHSYFLSFLIELLWCRRRILLVLQVGLEIDAKFELKAKFVGDVLVPVTQLGAKFSDSAWNAERCGHWGWLFVWGST